MNLAYNQLWTFPDNLSKRQIYQVLPERQGKERFEVLQDIHRRIVKYLRNYIYLNDDDVYDLVANWVIGTYFKDQFTSFPLLIFDGVTVSGKTTFLEALEKIVYRGELFTSATAASLAREIQDYHPTIILDEILDSKQSERWVDLYGLLKATFDINGRFMRADPRGRSNFKYRVYTPLAISIRGDLLPEDVYNRGIRINTTGKPVELELADLKNSNDDDVGGVCSPGTIRSVLYALKAITAKHSDDPTCSTKPELKGYVVNFSEYFDTTKQHFTEQMPDGQWLYAYVNSLPADSPRIRDRDRLISKTLYSIGLATNSEYGVISTIIKQAAMNREINADTQESLVFNALLDLIHDARLVEDDRLLYGNRGDIGALKATISQITTTDVARQYNHILDVQGNADRDPVKTKTVTATINALGLSYKRGTDNKSFLNPDDIFFIDNFNRCLYKYAPMSAHRYVTRPAEKTSSINGINNYSLTGS